MIIRTLRNALPLLLAFAAVGAQAQFYKLHSPDIAMGGVGQFTTTLTSDGTNAGGTNQQFTTNSDGLLISFQEHPVAWAGVEFNYGFTRYSQRFGYYMPATPGVEHRRQFPNDVHEITAAYMFHARVFHLQPFINVGGGALDFMPDHYDHMWRGTGLVETGLDFPTKGGHLGFRIQGRTLIYRAPNFYRPRISTRSWVSTEEPSASVYIRF
ncbi:MAG: hypothetical protein HIU91_09110 [Acidobacteria bacterium]|nr:hypothetical protein [Acidobacteriota bacterium]